MSRSFKKFPVVKDSTGPGKKFQKRLASKSVRRYKQGISNGSMFRKIYCSWNINDFWFYQTRRDAICEWETNGDSNTRKATRQQTLNKWEKFYRRK